MAYTYDCSLSDRVALSSAAITEVRNTINAERTRRGKGTYVITGYNTVVDYYYWP